MEDKIAGRILGSLTSVIPVLMALLLACATPAWAQDSEINQRAREYFLKGKKAYQQGLYEEAMKNFQMALAVRPSPILEYNIGRCHDKLGQHKAAITAYKRYLVFSPNAPNRKTVEARIAALKALQPRPEPPPVAPAAPAVGKPETPDEPGQSGTSPDQPDTTGETGKPATTLAPPGPSASEKQPAAPVHEAVVAMKRVQKKKPISSRSSTPAGPTGRDREKKPVYKKWYFWVAVAGAVVITGFIIGMAVDSNDRHVSSSTYPMSSRGGNGGMTVLTF